MDRSSLSTSRQLSTKRTPESPAHWGVWLLWAVFLGACLFGASVAIVVLSMLAFAGFVSVARNRDNIHWLEPDAKLILFTVVFFFVAAGLAAISRGREADTVQVAVYATVFLAIPVYFLFCRYPVYRVRGWPQVPAAALVVVAAVLAYRLFTDQGAGLVGPAPTLMQTPLGVAAVLVALLLPGVVFRRATRAPDAASRAVGVAGLALIAIFAGLSLMVPAFESVLALSFYGSSLAFLTAVVHQEKARYYTRAVKRKQSLSVIIIAQDEADRIGRCLESVSGWADEIIVLDSGSQDDTVAIAQTYADAVYETDWPGYGRQKQRALERAGGDWVLSIDADEEVTPELRHDIDQALSDQPACVGYRLPWGVVVYGKRLDFGRSARAPLRLFLREGSRFTDAEVHETVVVPTGKICTLRGRLLHYTHRDFGHALQKSAKYAWLGAQKRYAKGRRGGSLAGAFARGLWVFFQVYVLRLGFLDGRAGFLVAVTYSQGAFNKYAGLWALRREAALRKRE